MSFLPHLSHVLPSRLNARATVDLMARATEWRRTIGEYVEGASVANQHFKKICVLDEGETIERIRFTWQAGHATSTGLDASLFVVAAGINVVPLGTSTGSIEYPITNPNGDWLWWEGGIFQTIYFPWDGTNFFEVDVYPTGDCIRDAKARRKADVGGSDVWFQTQTTTLSSGQCDHYLTVVTSTLVLLAP